VFVAAAVVIAFERCTVDIVPTCGIFIVDVVFFTVFANAEDNADIFAFPLSFNIFTEDVLCPPPEESEDL
jgi:hypothetical protein